MATEVGSITVELMGGGMDGDTLVLSARSSVGPPRQLCYLTTAPGELGWLVYEAPFGSTGVWPEKDELHHYHYVGTYDLGKGKRLRR